MTVRPISDARWLDSLMAGEMSGYRTEVRAAQSSGAGGWRLAAAFADKPSPLQTIQLKSPLLLVPGRSYIRLPVPQPPRGRSDRHRGLPVRLHPEITRSRMDEPDKIPGERTSPTQSVDRAIDILELVAKGPVSLPAIVEKLGLPRTTCYRLASTLVSRGFLATSGRSGYRIGPRLAELAQGPQE
jgi:hypothetical protein